MGLEQGTTGGPRQGVASKHQTVNLAPPLVRMNSEEKASRLFQSKNEESQTNAKT